MSKQQNAIDRDRLPFVAPCQKLSIFAPFRWIRLGVKDLIEAPQQSLVYGLAVAVLIGAVSLIAWFRGSQWIMFGMLGGFVFLAPLVCVGLYAISAQLERGQEPVLARSLRAAFRRHNGNEAVFALVLLVIFLVWSRAAVIVTAVMYPTDGAPTTPELISFLAFGSGVGAITGDFELVEAGVAFAIFAFLPICQLHGAHATVDVFAASFPRWLNRFLVTFWEMALTAVVLLITWRLFAGMFNKMDNGETTFLLQFPVWWAYAASAFAATVASVVAVYCAVARVLDLVTGRSHLPHSEGASH